MSSPNRDSSVSLSAATSRPAVAGDAAARRNSDQAEVAAAITAWISAVLSGVAARKAMPCSKSASALRASASDGGPAPGSVARIAPLAIRCDSMRWRPDTLMTRSAAVKPAVSRLRVKASAWASRRSARASMSRSRAASGRPRSAAFSAVQGVSTPSRRSPKVGLDSVRPSTARLASTWAMDSRHSSAAVSGAMPAQPCA